MAAAQPAREAKAAERAAQAKAREEARLAKSKFRSRFHLSDIEKSLVNEKGIATIRANCEGFIRTRLAPAYPKGDGRQTPTRGHPVFVAQHAITAPARGGYAAASRSGNAPAPKASGWVSAKRELRSSRKAPRKCRAGSRFPPSGNRASSTFLWRGLRWRWAYDARLQMPLLRGVLSYQQPTLTQTGRKCLVCARTGNLATLALTVRQIKWYNKRKFFKRKWRTKLTR